MAFYQQFNPFNTQNQQKKRIDSQKIFPKRLGTYQNGNALVLQYYNLQTDKFKKHVIPIDRSKSAKENVNEIYKNPKHGVLLRKVQMKYIEAVLNGQVSYNSNSYNTQHNNQPQHQPSYITHSHSSQQQNSSQYQPQQYSQPQQFNQSNSATNNNTFKSQNQLSSIIVSKSSEYLNEQTKERINEVQEEYEEEFEDYEISQSMGNMKDKGKKGQMANPVESKKQQHPVNLSINSNTGNNNSISIPLQSKYNNQTGEEVQQKKPKKSKKSKQKKSKKKKDEEYDDFQFDLLDDEGNVPKKPAKEKSKEKSKEKKQKKPEKQKQTKKAKQVQEDAKPKKKVVQEVIQEDFQFL